VQHQNAQLPTLFLFLFGRIVHITIRIRPNSLLPLFGTPLLCLYQSILRCSLYSVLLSSLIVRCTRLSTVGDRLIKVNRCLAEMNKIAGFCIYNLNFYLGVIPPDPAEAPRCLDPRTPILSQLASVPIVHVSLNDHWCRPCCRYRLF